jgi:hypothetical protein
MRNDPECSGVKNTKDRRHLHLFPPVIITPGNRSLSAGSVGQREDGILKVGIAVIVVLALMIVCILILNRPRLVEVDAEIPAEFPGNGFSHASFERLLQAYVDDSGHVDYRSWQSNIGAVQALDSYLAAVSAFSPESTP